MTAGRPRTNHDQILKILELVNKGVPERQIVSILGVSKGVVHRVKKGILPPLTSGA